jgi:hypothetical protein
MLIAWRERPYGEHGLSNTFIKLLDKAGIEKRLLRTGNAGKGRAVRALSFHSFRHTAASNVFNQALVQDRWQVLRPVPGQGLFQAPRFALCAEK